MLNNPQWSFLRPSIVALLCSLAEAGMIQMVLGGPPCGTFSRLRHLQWSPGPPPVRSRGAHVWGLPWLTGAAARRVQESNLLLVNYVVLAEAVVMAGGLFALEHPEDPGEDPYPSIWSTSLITDFERRTMAKRRLIHQCRFGCRARKATTISGNGRTWGGEPIL